ncbi:MAG: hypothetical protein H0W68_02405, partial [Gemmatimonadaceae bacterium]|nr:hypothetical protein [Gemmatimonadaceae bacterium]
MPLLARAVLVYVLVSLGAFAGTGSQRIGVAVLFTVAALAGIATRRAAFAGVLGVAAAACWIVEGTVRIEAACTLSVAHAGSWRATFERDVA